MVPRGLDTGSERKRHIKDNSKDLGMKLTFKNRYRTLFEEKEKEEAKKGNRKWWSQCKTELKKKKKKSPGNGRKKTKSPGNGREACIKLSLIDNNYKPWAEYI